MDCKGIETEMCLVSLIKLNPYLGKNSVKFNDFVGLASLVGILREKKESVGKLG